MSEVAVEAIILAINALGGGILLFVSGVVQKMMWLTLLSVALMACQFSIEGTAIAVAACTIIAYPSLWLARKYIPNGSHR